MTVTAFLALTVRSVAAACPRSQVTEPASLEERPPKRRRVGVSTTSSSLPSLPVTAPGRRPDTVTHGFDCTPSSVPDPELSAIEKAAISELCSSRTVDSMFHQSCKTYGRKSRRITGPARLPSNSGTVALSSSCTVAASSPTKRQAPVGVTSQRFGILLCAHFSSCAVDVALSATSFSLRSSIR